MKKAICIALVLLWKLSFSQDSCRPQYRLPVHTLEVAQVKLAYVEEGKGPAILMLHGVGGNLSHWLKVMHQLSTDFHCIAIDLPGYGYSDKKFDKGTADALQYDADLLVQFIKKLKLKKLVVAGHSMGGQIAMILAAQHPELVSRLVLVAPAGLEIFTTAEATMMTGATPPSVFEKQDEAVINANYRRNFFVWPQDASQLVKDRLAFRSCTDFPDFARAVSEGVKGMLAHPVKEQWNSLRMPVLLVYGANDALIPNLLFHPTLTGEGLVKEFTTSVPQTKVLRIPECGHLVQFEKPVETADAIKNFLR
jgi:pimeloyl-ACP methyl ester carboxylesterase